MGLPRPSTPGCHRSRWPRRRQLLAPAGFSGETRGNGVNELHLGYWTLQRLDTRCAAGRRAPRLPPGTPWTGTHRSDRLGQPTVGYPLSCRTRLLTDPTTGRRTGFRTPALGSILICRQATAIRLCRNQQFVAQLPHSAGGWLPGGHNVGVRSAQLPAERSGSSRRCSQVKRRSTPFVDLPHAGPRMPIL